MPSSNSAIAGWGGAALAFAAGAAIGLGWGWSPELMPDAPPSAPLGPGSYAAHRVWDQGRSESGSLWVSVIDESGRPCASASVWLMQEDVRSLHYVWWTNDDGRVGLDWDSLRTRGDRVRLVALAGGWAGEIVCAASDTAVQIRLTERSLVVRGKLGRRVRVSPVFVGLRGQIDSHSFAVTGCDVPAGEEEFTLVPIPESWVSVLTWATAATGRKRDSLIFISADGRQPSVFDFHSCSPNPLGPIARMRRDAIRSGLTFLPWKE